MLGWTIVFALLALLGMTPPFMGFTSDSLFSVAGAIFALLFLTMLFARVVRGHA